MTPNDEYCPNAKDDDDMHCVCWWDGDGCCRCKAPGLTDEQKREQGMIE